MSQMRIEQRGAMDIGGSDVIIVRCTKREGVCGMPVGMSQETEQVPCPTLKGG